MKRLKFGFGKKLKQLTAVSALVLSLFVANAMLSAQPNASAAPTFGAPFDSDSNAVLWGGASSVSVIQKDYTKGDGHNSAASIQNIYQYFKISSSDISSLGTTAVAGSVTKSGDVYVGSTKVATGARTAGRQYISGCSSSTEVARSYNGTNFYGRSPSCSFENNSLTAYVVMQNGQFKFAILSSCGNPVNATPVAKPAPAPTPVVKAGALACAQLMGMPGTTDSNGNVSYTFAAKATSTNANVSSYVFDFGNGSTQTLNTSAMQVTSQSVTFAPGTHTVKVTIAGVANGSNVTAPKAVICSTTFIVSQPPSQPQQPTQPQTASLTCNSLTRDEGTADGNGNITHIFTVNATANNATITGYDFTVSPNTVTMPSVTTSAQNLITQPVVFAPNTPYTVTATVKGTSNADGSTLPNSTTAVCKLSFTTPVHVVTTAVITPAAPTTMPSTGAGSVVGLFAGASIAGFFGYRFFLSRRLSRQ